MTSQMIKYKQFAEVYPSVVTRVEEITGEPAPVYATRQMAYAKVKAALEKHPDLLGRMHAKCITRDDLKLVDTSGAEDIRQKPPLTDAQLTQLQDVFYLVAQAFTLPQAQ